VEAPFTYVTSTALTIAAKCIWMSVTEFFPTLCIPLPPFLPTLFGHRHFQCPQTPVVSHSAVMFAYLGRGSVWYTKFKLNDIYICWPKKTCGWNLEI